MTEVRSNREGSHTGSAPGDEPPQLPSSRFVVRTTLLVLSVVLGVAIALWVLFSLRGILILLVLAVFFAYLVAPLVGFCRRPVTLKGRKFVLPLPAAIGVVYLLSSDLWRRCLSSCSPSSISNSASL
jgi:hypothetical protein